MIAWRVCLWVEWRRLRRWSFFLILGLTGVFVTTTANSAELRSSTMATLVKHTWHRLPLHAPILSIFIWILPPSLYLMAIGEPWSPVRQSWLRAVSSRSGFRFSLWAGTLAAEYGIAIIAVGIFVATTIIAGITIGHFVWQPGTWKIIEIRGLAEVAVLWTYTSLLYGINCAVRRPGWGTVGALGVGYLWTMMILTTGVSVARWSPPLIGSRATYASSLHAIWVAVAFTAAVLVGHWQVLKRRPL